MGAATLYLDYVYKQFSLPDKIISDRDPRFVSQLFQKLGRILSIKLAMSATYHPQTDGETEQVNQEVEIYLCIFCSNNPKSWKHLLPTTEFTHNQRTHSIQKNLPFYLMMGYEPKLVPLPYTKMNVPELEQRIIKP